MKRIIIICISLLFTCFAFAQEDTESLVRVGIKLHDEGEFIKAIETYKKALAIEPDSPIINYEISLTYMSLKDYENALKYSDIVLKLNKGALIEAYNVKGSALDYLGKTKEAIEVYKEAIEKLGGSNLLYYNLSYSYFRIKDFTLAEETIILAIKENPYHSSSHLLLAYIQAESKKLSQSLLCLYYFLLLEPDTERSYTAILLFDRLCKEAVPVQEGKQTIVIDGPKSSANDYFANIDFMLKLIIASHQLDEENLKQNSDDKFIDTTKSFFSLFDIIDEKNKDAGNNFWRNFYLPFFSELTKENHVTAFCYYITQSANKNTFKWAEDNQESMEKFINWLNK